MRFENPTRPPFLRGGQRLWRRRSYSPSELRYTPRPHLSRPQIQISLACFWMPSVHTYHGYLDDPPSGPFSVALFLCLLTAWEDTFTPPWASRYAGPWSNSTRWYYPLIQQRIYPSSQPVPNTLTISHSTTSPVTGWRNVPSFLACAMKLELWAICNPWPLPLGLKIFPS